MGSGRWAWPALPRVWSVETLLVAVALALGVTALGSSPAAAAESPVVRAGERAGPVDVRGGSRLGTVARLRLGPGNWTVVAKGVIRNTTRSGTARPVRCRVVLGGASAQVLASPASRGTDASRRPFLVTHAAHLSREDTAKLQCGAPGSSTGALVVDDIRMAAVRTSALFVRSEGHLGRFYGNADAASQVRYLIGRSHALDDDIAPVSTLPLSPGRWAVTATATIQHTSAIGASQVYCRLDPDEDLTLVAVEPEGEQNDRAPIALQALVSSGTGLDVVLSCQERNGHPGVRVRDIRLTAYRVTASARGELDPGATFSPFGAWIKPVVFMGWADYPPAIDVSDTWRTVSRMSLPPGRWLIVSTMSVGQAVDGRSSLACRIGRGGDWDQTEGRLAAHGALDESQQSVGLWVGAFDRARQVRLECRSSRGTVGLSFIRIVAYQAGTLRLRSLR